MIGIYCALFWAAIFTRPFQIHGSGTMYDPPNRAVMWKYGFPTQKNYNYMQLNCGGVKQPENGTFNCGICGDSTDGVGAHERGGKYGSGMISRYYPVGVKEIPINIEILAFEKGYFEFRICPANNDTVTQECLDENLLPIKEAYLSDKRDAMRFYPKAAGDHRLTIAINPKLRCERCVLQWRYHTANSWGTDPTSQKEGIGLGVQDEFRNCADIRIGGEVPSSVRNNPFFGTSIANKISTTVDTPQARVKALKALMTSSLAVQPEHADHLSPGMRTVIFDGSSQTTDLSGHSSAWIKQALNGGQAQGHGNMMEPITSKMRISSDNSNSIQFGGDSAAGIATIKKLLRPADGRIKLTAGSDIIKVGKGEGRMRKIQPDMQILSKNTMTNIDGQIDSSFALNNQLGGNSDINSFVLNNQLGGVDATTMDHRGLTGAMHTIAAGVLGSSSGGHNLERNLPGQDASTGTGTFGGTIGLLGPPPNPETKGTIAITASTMVGPSTDNFGTMREATRSAFSFDGEGAFNAAVGANANYIKDSATMSSSGASISTGMTEGMAPGTTSTGTEYRSSSTGNVNLGNNVIYDSMTTQMNAMTGQSKDRKGDGQRIFQIKVNKPMVISEGMQPSVDISAGASATIGTDIPSTSGFIGKSSSSSDQYDVASSGFSSTVGGITGAQSASSSNQYDVASTGFSSTVDGSTEAKSTLGQSATDINVANEIDALRTGLIQSSLLQGGGNSRRFSQGNANSEAYTGDVYTEAEIASGSNSIQATTSATNFDGMNNGFIERNINAIVNQANKIMKSAGDTGSISIHDTVHKGGLSANLVNNPNVQHDIMKSLDNVISNTKQKTNTIQSIDNTAHDGVLSANLVNNPIVQQAIMKVLSNTKQKTNTVQSIDYTAHGGVLSANLVNNPIVQQAIMKVLSNTKQETNTIQSTDNTAHGGGLSANLVNNPNVQQPIMKVLSNTKQETNTIQSIDNTAHGGVLSANLVNNPNVQQPIMKVLSNTKQETNTIQSGVDIGKAARVISKQNVAMGQYTGGSSGGLEVQQKGVFFESMFGGGGNAVDLAGPGSDGAMSQTRSGIVETNSGPSGNQLGGSTIDLSQSDTNRLSGSLHTSGTKARVVTQNAESINKSGRLQGGNNRASTGGGTLSINQQENRIDQRTNQAFVRVPGRRRIDGRERSRTETDSVNIESQLSSFNLGSIPEDSVMNTESRRRNNNEFRLNGEARSSGRREMNRNMNTQADRTRGENRVTTVGGDRMDSSRQNLRIFDKRRRAFSVGSRGGDLPSPDMRGGGFRVVIDPRTGVEVRVPARDSFTGRRFRETARPFGRRAGDRLISDIRGGGSRRSSNGEGDRRSTGTARSDRGRFDIRTIDRTSTSRSRERLPTETRMESFGRSVAVRTGDRPLSDRRSFRDPKYFVDMTGSGTRVNATNVVIDSGIANRGMQGGRGPAAMPRDAVAAFDAESAGRRDMSVVTGGSRSDRGGSRDTRLVIEGDLSRSRGGRTSDRDFRRDSRGRSQGEGRSVDTGRRSDSRDRRRDMGIRHDGQLIGGGGRGMMPIGGMPGGGMPGGGMPGGRMPGGGMPGGGMTGGGMPGGGMPGGGMPGGGMPGGGMPGGGMSGGGMLGGGMPGGGMPFGGFRGGGMPGGGMPGGGMPGGGMPGGGMPGGGMPGGGMPGGGMPGGGMPGGGMPGGGMHGGGMLGGPMMGGMPGPMMGGIPRPFGGGHPGGPFSPMGFRPPGML